MYPVKKFRILGLLLAAQTCHAMTNQIEFSLGRGSPESSIQVGGSAENPGDRGHAWSADWLHQNGPYVYWGIGGGHFNSEDHTTTTFVPTKLSILSTRSTSIFLLSRVDLTPPSKLVPYVIFGTGWDRTSISATAGSTPVIDESHSTLGYMAGGGIDWPLTDRLFIGAEARYQSALQRNYDLTPEGQALTGQATVQSTMKVFFLNLKAGIKY